MVHRIAIILAVLGALVLPSAAASAQGAPFCPPGAAPEFVRGLAELKSHLGETMGQPIECEHWDAQSGDMHQRTTTGLAYWRHTTNTPSFTDGFRHWALTNGQLLYWEGSEVEPPPRAIDLAAPAPAPAPAPGSAPMLGSIEQPGRIVGAFNVRSEPRIAAATFIRQLGHNTPVWVSASVRGSDGDTWYRLDTGEYVHSSGVRLPSPPPQTFAGRWIDADLTTPAMITAYEGNRPVYSALAVKGVVSFQTPTGIFEIIRRVPNETMDSATIGIPRNAPQGYYLEDVLFTQYFTSGGAAIHYNWWESNWGYGGSHGCLGLNYEDSQWFWEFASLGTPLVVHQ